ncbi:SEA domain-containing protein [Aphelenchoides fujianensis]|nr:SEA domain-containing protein [Aphelenchoides fujianensis]
MSHGRFPFRRSVESLDRQYDIIRVHFAANPGSVHSNFDPNATVSYEPGSGAEAMRQMGASWHDRDAYGNPLPSTRYTPARRADAERTVQFGSSAKSDGGLRENMTYLIPIAVLSALLILFILAIVILFVTGGKPSIFIVDQANAAYNDPTSAEYEQASIIVRNALNTLIAQSTIRDLDAPAGGRTASKPVGSFLSNNPSVSFCRGNDLRVPFRITLVLLASSRLTAESIQNVLLSELSLLELQLNNTIVDRSRVHVRLIE